MVLSAHEHGRCCETVQWETHTDVVHAEPGGQSTTTHKKRGINKEMKGWRVRENFTPKCWQSVQSRGTKNLNLEKDWEDIQSTARRVGWCEEEKTAKLWKQLKGDEQ